MAKGIIALDIDGTLVSNHRPLSAALRQELTTYCDSGYLLLFATGRTLHWGMNHLRDLSRPFYLAAYNGAVLCKLPEQAILRTAFLSLSEISVLWPFVQQFGAIIYEGVGEERIFYTPKLFSPKILDHVHARRNLQKETFVEISSFMDLPRCPYASIRLFVAEPLAQILGETISARTLLRAPTMKDSLNPTLRVVQVTMQEASKGQALEYLQTLFPIPTIAAGDDMNDVDMLQKSSVAIAMHEAPLVVQQLAAIVAPPFSDDCIIAPLREAVARL